MQAKLNNNIFFALVFLLVLTTACNKEDLEEEKRNLENMTLQEAQSNPLPDSVECNGILALCNKSIDNILFAASQQSFNSTYYGAAPQSASQQISITEQLNTGIRTLQFDIYEVPLTLSTEADVDYTTLRLRPNPADEWELGFPPLLKEVKEFLNANPHELLVLLLKGNFSTTRLEEEFNATGLDEYLYRHNANQIWPVMGRLVYENKRLIVFTQNKNQEGDLEWNHTFDSYITESEAGFASISDIRCNSNIEKPFYALHHYSTNENADYDLINSSTVLLENLLQCTDEIENKPQFLLLKQVHQGNILEPIRIINGN